jgi:tetratricopeptide (TPR) repeat protein
MLGNIISKTDRDFKTAIQYYDQAVAISPNNAIVINNIGANLLSLGKPNDANRYFELALEIDPNYPNALMGMAKYHEVLNNPVESFRFASQALKTCKHNDPLKRHAFNQMMHSANQADNSDYSKYIIESRLDELSKLSGKPILLQVDDTIPTQAKLELAENFERPEDIIKYKPNSKGVNHLIMHELMHL